MTKRVVAVRNQGKGTEVAGRVRVADTPLARLVGLLNRSRLEPGEGLWIYPSKAIHTVGMRFAIDVIFLDPGRRVRRVYHGLAPWRVTRLVWGATSVLELPASAASNSKTEVGDELQIERL